MNTIGERIKHYRKIHGYSQEELAKKLGVQRQTIANYEKDAVTPTLDRIEQLSAWLGVPPILLMYGNTSVDSLDSFQAIQQLKTELSILELLITNAIATDEEYISLPVSSETIEDRDNPPLPKAIKLDDLTDVLNQCKRYFTFLASQKSFDYILKSKDTEKD